MDLAIKQLITLVGFVLVGLLLVRLWPWCWEHIRTKRCKRVSNEMLADMDAKMAAKKASNVPPHLASMDRIMDNIERRITPP